MDTNLIKTRLISFAYEAFSLIITGFVGVLASDEFRAIILEHTGETITGSIAVLVLAGIVKHLRNLSVVKKYEQVGARDGVLLEKPTII